MVPHEEKQEAKEPNTIETTGIENVFAFALVPSDHPLSTRLVGLSQFVSTLVVPGEGRNFL